MGKAKRPEGGEEGLARLWREQAPHIGALLTSEGIPLRVLFPGLRRRGAGPDFRHALVVTPHALLRGDVEAHVRASEFRRHGHHRDPAYDALVLHVVLRADEGDTALRCGRRVPVAALSPSSTGQGRWEERCRSAVRRLGTEETARVLQRLGDARLAEKVQRWLPEVRCRGPEDALYVALCEAMGYSQNREPFRALAQRLPWPALRGCLLALPPVGRPAAAQALLAAAAQAPPPLPWQVHGLRPANRPRARLRALAHLLARWSEEGLFAGLARRLREGASSLLAALQGPGLGQQRALELAVNAVVPVTLAQGLEGERGLALAALAAYRALPRPGPYVSLRHLEEALGGQVPLGAREQQGLLQLLRRYCTQGACGRCPLS